MHRGSKVSPMTTSPPTTLVAHCSLSSRKGTAFPGVASAHSGLSGSAKKETSEKELLVVVNESANRTPDAAQDLFEKWICGERRGAGSEPETGGGGGLGKREARVCAHRFDVGLVEKPRRLRTGDLDRVRHERRPRRAAQPREVGGEVVEDQAAEFCVL